jgi:hypothetical protein
VLTKHANPARARRDCYSPKGGRIMTEKNEIPSEDLRFPGTIAIKFIANYAYSMGAIALFTLKHLLREPPKIDQQAHTSHYREHYLRRMVFSKVELFSE